MPPLPDPIEILLIRHGETEANLADIWQGHTDSPLSPRGVSQAERLSKRLAGVEFGAVYTSDLDRTVATAAGVSTDVRADPRLREMHLGSWEGMSKHDVARRHPDDLAALRGGEDLRIGGGERRSELVARTMEALHDIALRHEPGERVMVVSHGGPIISAVASILGLPWGRGLARVANTAITRLHAFTDGGVPRFAVAGFNDVEHLEGDHLYRQEHATAVWMVRHGQTRANVEGRWQGRGDFDLTDLGRQQVDALERRPPPVVGVRTSPLRRARRTAEAIAAARGVPIEVDDDLAEIAFGAWEDLTTEEIEARFPDEMARFRAGEDLRRGGNGETYDEVIARMRRAVLGAVPETADEDAVATVTHGGATRAFLVGALGLAFPARHRIGILRNTGMARLGLRDGKPVLIAYDVAPHLDL